MVCGTLTEKMKSDGVFSYQAATVEGDGVPSAEPGSGARQLRLPGYQILRELGRGGMGVVYESHQIRLKRAVAIKMILAGACASPKELARFRVEAEAVARLQHPHIVQIYEVGEHNGFPYFSLELIEGQSLEKKIAGRPQPPRESAQLVETLAHAVHHAHQNNAGDHEAALVTFRLAAQVAEKVPNEHLRRLALMRNVPIRNSRTSEA